jgi:parallel beta-helix repeat protein
LWLIRAVLHNDAVERGLPRVMRTKSLSISMLVAAVSLPYDTRAAVVEISPGADVRAAIAALRPGDELVLRGGSYAFNSRFAVTAVGTATQPITIRGKSGEVAVISNVPTQNVMEVDGSQYLILKNLTVTGGSHGVRLMNSDYVTLENNEVYETGDVAISANSGGTYEGLVIRGNHIHHTNDTGEGLYLGCNNDGCRVANSIIEWNYIHHTNGPTVVQGDGIEIKEGSYGNIVRHNVVHDTNYPGILTYSTVGNGPPNVIEGNVIWNTRDYAIQSAADSVIRNNIILGSSISLQPHQAGNPSNQVVVHNTVIGASIEVRNVVGSVVVANNAVYSSSGAAIRLISGNLSLVTLAGNVGAGGISGAATGYTNGGGLGADFVNGHYNGAPPIDLFPTPVSALRGAGSSTYVTPEDFNGTSRAGVADAGAYKYDAGGNPGWTLGAGFKSGSSVRPNPPTNVRSN